jgi:hypothetical protein
MTLAVGTVSSRRAAIPPQTEGHTITKDDSVWGVERVSCVFSLKVIAQKCRVVHDWVHCILDVADPAEVLSSFANKYGQPKWGRQESYIKDFRVDIQREQNN